MRGGRAPVDAVGRRRGIARANAGRTACRAAGTHAADVLPVDRKGRTSSARHVRTWTCRQVGAAPAKPTAAQTMRSGAKREDCRSTETTASGPVSIPTVTKLQPRNRLLTTAATEASAPRRRAQQLAVETKHLPSAPMTALAVWPRRTRGRRCSLTGSHRSAQAAAWQQLCPKDQQRRRVRPVAARTEQRGRGRRAVFQTASEGALLTLEVRHART